MSIVVRPPPSVPLEIIADNARREFDLSGKLQEIPAERDQNVRIASSRGSFLLKVCSAREGMAAARAQAFALEHIAAVDNTLPVPRVQRTKTGAIVGQLQHEGASFPLLLLSWIEGEVLGEYRLQRDQYRAYGRLLARLGKALRGFSDPGPISRYLIWDLMRADALIEHIHLLAGDFVEKAGDCLSRFQREIKPRLKSFRAQIIHGDVHPYNTIHDGAGGITGIIDFGDMIHGPLILDLSNTTADCLGPGAEPEETLHMLTKGYVEAMPIEESEADVIVDLVAVRLLMTAIISKLRLASKIPNTPGIASLAESSLASFAAVDKMQDELRAAVRHAAGFPLHVARHVPPDGDILQRRKAAMGARPLLFYSKPLHMISGEGVWLNASDGRAYLDCYNNVPHVGHGHPYVVEAVARQLRRINTNTRYLTDEAVEYAERLKATLDPSLSAVVFVNSGSEANDVAWRMAKVWTGKSGALCMDFAYHGVTEATDAFSPSNYPPGKWKAAHVRLLEPPDQYRGPYKAGTKDIAAKYAALADKPIRALRQKKSGLAMAIMDQAFMTNGMLDAPKGYVRGVMERVRAAGGLFVADEVQSGFGRMGHDFWGHQYHGVIPDFVTIGKPAGNGYPLGAVITRPEILERFVSETGPFFSTFGGGNAACAAGLAVLDVIRDEDLMQNAILAGGRLRDKLASLAQRHDIIGDVRGVGLATGVELVKDRKTLAPALAETRTCLDLMRDEGVLVGSDGKSGNVLKLRPPLVFTVEHADMVAEALDRVLARL